MNGCGAALEARLELRASSKSSSTAPFARKKPPAHDPAERASGSSGQLARRSAGRRARSRTARRPRCPTSTLCCAALDEAVEQRRPQHRAARRERLGQRRARPGRDRRPGASTCTPRRSRRRRATSSTTRRSRCSCVSRPNMLAPLGQRRRHLLELGSATTSSTRSISRRTSRARHVGTVTLPVVRDLEAEPREPRPLLARRGSAMPTTCRGPLRPQLDHGALGEPAVDVRVRRPSARPRARRSARSRRRAACSASYGSTPFSQRFERLGAQVRAARALRETPTGSKFAASSRTTVVSSARPRSPRRP